MTTEFKLGYIAAKNDSPESQYDDKSREFWDGFAQYMRDQDNTEDYPDSANPD